MNGPGVHLMVDGLSQMPYTQGYLESYMGDLVHLVGMEVIWGPKVTGEKRTWYGITILAESHTSLHIKSDHVWVDLFSCQWYDYQVPLNMIRDRLGFSTDKVTVVERPMPTPIGVQ